MCALQKNDKDCARLYRGHWCHFQSMLFLRDTLKAKHADDEYGTSTNNGQANAIHNGIPVHSQPRRFLYYDEPRQVNAGSDPESISSNSPDQTKQRADRRAAYENERYELESQKVASTLKHPPPEDEDLSFFRALIPFMKLFHPLQKSHFRNIVQTLLFREFSHAPTNINAFYPNHSTTVSSTIDPASVKPYTDIPNYRPTGVAPNITIMRPGSTYYFGPVKKTL